MTSAAQLVNQRYTANSCTLEITAAHSALSQWSQQPILKQVRFRLWIENPETAQPGLVAQGDQVQLSNLNNSIQHYIQTHLNHSGAAALVSPGFSPELAWPLTQHQLAIAGQLEPLSLSTLELFDITEVLDQYEQSNQLLPALPSTVARRRRPVSLWAGSAVAAMVLTVGVTATLRQYYQQASTTQADRAIPETTLEQAAPDSDTAAGESALSPKAPSTNLSEATPSPTPPNPKIAADPNQEQETGADRAVAPESPTASPPTTPQASAPRPNPTISNQPSASESSGRNQTVPAPSADSSSNPEVTAAGPPPDRGRVSTTSPDQTLRDESQRGNVTSSSEPAEADLGNGITARSAEPGSRPSTTLSQPPVPIPEIAESETENNTISGNQQFSANGTDMLASPAPAQSEFSATLQEVSAYFRARWQGSRSNEPLIYELWLNPNGTLAAWNPLNAPATRQRWTFPSEALVSPFEKDSRLRLQVILYPNGQVQVSE